MHDAQWRLGVLTHVALMAIPIVIAVAVGDDVITAIQDADPRPPS